MDELVADAEDRLQVTLNDAEQSIVNALALDEECELERDATVRSDVLRWILTLERTNRVTTEPPFRLTGGIITGDVVLSACQIERPVRFRSTSFRGDVRLRETRLRSLRFVACSGQTLDLNGAVVEGSFVIDRDNDDASHFTSVSLVGASVDRNIEIYGLSLSTPVDSDEDDPTGMVDISNSTVAGTVAIEQGSYIPGGIRAVRCRVARDCFLVGATFGHDQSQVAVDFERAEIGGALFLRPEKDVAGAVIAYSSARGRIVMEHARVRNDVDLRSLVAWSAEPPGLAFRNVDIGGSLWMNDATVESGIDLGYATIAQNVELSGLVVNNSETEKAVREPPDDELMLSLENAAIGERLIWDALLPEGSSVSFERARAGRFEYASDLSWAAHADLHAFRYDSIDSGYLPFKRPALAEFAKRRFGWSPVQEPDGRLASLVHEAAFVPDRTHLRWLRSHRSGETDTAMYEHLAQVHAISGRPKEAEEVAMAATNDRRRAEGFVRVLIGLPFRVFAGNGYRPSRAIWWALAFVVCGALVYEANQIHIAFANEDVGWARTDVEPFIFSADTLLPIVDLGEAERFEMTSGAPTWLRWFRWSQIAVGWVIASALGATAARLSRSPRS